MEYGLLRDSQILACGCLAVLCSIHESPIPSMAGRPLFGIGKLNDPAIAEAIKKLFFIAVVRKAPQRPGHDSLTAHPESIAIFFFGGGLFLPEVNNNSTLIKMLSFIQ